MGKAAGVHRRKRKRTKPHHAAKKNKYKRLKLKSKKPIATETEIRDNWDPDKTAVKNLIEMGLGLDPNKIVTSGITSGKEALIQQMETDASTSVSKLSRKKQPRTKTFVAEAIDVKSQTKPPPSFRFSLPEERWITSMLDKYGEDFAKIARDPKNTDQLTPNQVKHKINKFKSSADQWAQYLKKRGLLPTDGPVEAMEV